MISCSLTAIRLVRVVITITLAVIHFLRIDTLTSGEASEFIIFAKRYGSDKEIVKLDLKDLLRMTVQHNTTKQNKTKSYRTNKTTASTTKKR